MQGEWTKTPPPAGYWYWWRAKSWSQPQPCFVNRRSVLLFYGSPARMPLTGWRRRVRGWWWTIPMELPATPKAPSDG